MTLCTTQHLATPTVGATDDSLTLAGRLSGQQLLPSRRAGV